MFDGGFFFRNPDPKLVLVGVFSRAPFKHLVGVNDGADHVDMEIDFRLLFVHPLGRLHPLAADRIRLLFEMGNVRGEDFGLPYAATSILLFGIGKKIGGFSLRAERKVFLLFFFALGLNLAVKRIHIFVAQNPFRRFFGETLISGKIVEDDDFDLFARADRFHPVQKFRDALDIDCAHLRQKIGIIDDAVKEMERFGEFSIRMHIKGGLLLQNRPF